MAWEHCTATIERHMSAYRTMPESDHISTTAFVTMSCAAEFIIVVENKFTQKETAQ